MGSLTLTFEFGQWGAQQKKGGKGGQHIYSPVPLPIESPLAGALHTAL